MQAYICCIFEEVWEIPKKVLKSIDLSSGRGGYHLEKESIICRGCVSSGRGG
jgi:hypothetical protein